MPAPRSIRAARLATDTDTQVQQERTQLVAHRTRSFLGVILGALLWLAAPCGQAQSQSREYDFNIPRLPLAEALALASEQAQMLYGYSPQSDEEERIPVGPIKGRFTIDALLTKMLPEGFGFTWINERNITILSPPVVTLPALPVSSGITVEQDLSATLEQGSSARLANKLQGILVVASRLWGDDSPQSPTALSQLDRPTIEALGVSTLPDLLRYLTQQPFARSDLSTLGDQRVELRGLGRDTTLVLVNGRRVGTASASFDIDAFDLNSVPLAAVERIEIIQDFIPFAIGADAIGGMINIVLRNDFARPLLEVTYGAVDSGAAERRASAGVGGRIGTVRLSGLLDHFERSGLLGGSRERWRDQDYRRFGSLDYRSLASNPGNVHSLTLDNLPGLSSRFAAVPRHEPGQPLATEDFLATAGSENLDSLRRYRSIVPERERSSVLVSAEVPVSRTGVLFTELFYSSGTTVVRDAPVALSEVVVPASNAFNPFGTPVGASFLFSGLDARTWTTEGSFEREVAGLQGQWRRWAWELSLQHARDTTRVSQANELDPMRLADAVAQSNPDRALNLFDDGPGGEAGLIESLIAPPIVRDYASESLQATATVRGELMEVPAGALSLSWGGEWRESSMSIDTRLPRSPRRAVTSGFVELRVPLVDRRMALPGVRGLAFAASGRLDQFGDMGRITNEQLGLTWQPVESVSVRASLGTSFRPPSVFELYVPLVHLPFTLVDLRRNNQITNVQVTVGGNPDLDATTARSWSAGLSFEGKSAHHLRMAANYWNARLKEQITPIALPTLLTHDERFPGRILREPQTAADIAAGLPGTLVALDVRPGNIGALEASGVDVSASMDAETRFGRLMPTFSVAWMEKFRVIDAPGLPAVDRVGRASILGTIPRWRAVAGMTWSRDGVSVTTNARWVSSYEDFDSAMNRNNGRTVGAQAFLDIQTALELDPYLSLNSPWRGLRLTAGVTNLLNAQPPFAEVGADFGYDITQGDLKGRFSYVRLAKRF